MSSQIKPIKIYGIGGPNPLKITIIFSELDIPYEIVPIPFSDVKKAEYIAINPNGRLPSIQDPNTGITLWESGAIIEYLIDRYDPSHKLSFSPGSAEWYHSKQWLYFQMSGQGPYFGQIIWFMKLHEEIIPSAIERYVKELNRVTAVLDGHLAKQKLASGNDEAWLVGNRISFADLAFLPWYTVMGKSLPSDQYSVNDYPHVKLWLENMSSRKSFGDSLKSVPLGG
ncbi:hypothetical protein VE03_06577 [Pseudogymnoascus sp. 23342-1-I1]|nr:hypothetical protein VE03_06577 [Pseudogymnoascus sp. 23342-1-I1]